jgi:hypothetical protein
VQYPKLGGLFLFCFSISFFFLLSSGFAGVDNLLTGSSTASICDSLSLTNTITNTGGVLGGLKVTNSLPNGSFTYLLGETVITLPGPVTRSGTNADPDRIIGGTNLVWDFSTLATPCTVSHVLISEVYYNDSHSAAENKNAYQWVELFNPTTNSITLTGYKLQDAVPGRTDNLPTMTLAAGEFVIVAGTTNAFYSGHSGYTGQVFQVADGEIGNGFNDYGDGVFLLDAASAVIDGVSYGICAAAFSLPCELTLVGRSLARSPAANADTGTSSEWATLVTPSPGTGEIPTGLQTGGGVTIVYKVAGSCSAATGQFVANTAYQQPPVRLQLIHPPANQSLSMQETYWYLRPL